MSLGASADAPSSVTEETSAAAPDDHKSASNSPILRTGILVKKGARSGILTQRQVIATQSSLVYSQKARVSRTVPLLDAQVTYKEGSHEFTIVDLAKQKYIFRVPTCKDTAAAAQSWAGLLQQAASTLKCSRHGVLRIHTPGVDKCKDRKVWLTQRCLIYEHVAVKKEGFAVVPLARILLPLQRVPLEHRLVLNPKGGNPTHIDFVSETELQSWLTILTRTIRERQIFLGARTKKFVRQMTSFNSFNDVLAATATKDLESGVITQEGYQKIIATAQRNSGVFARESPSRRPRSTPASCAVCLQHFSGKVKKLECSACHRGICSACCTMCPDVYTGEQRRLCNICLEAEQDNVIGGWDDHTWQTEVHPCIKDAIEAVSSR